MEKKIDTTILHIGLCRGDIGVHWGYLASLCGGDQGLGVQGVRMGDSWVWRVCGSFWREALQSRAWGLAGVQGLCQEVQVAIN